MADYISETQSNPDCIELHEKWNENIKKHPIAIGFLFVFFVVIPFLLCVFSPGETSIMIMLFLCLFTFFLLINILTIIKLFSPNHYEVSTTGGRIKILKNGVEVLNVAGQQITFLKFNINPVGKDVNNLRISYTDDNSKTKYFTLPLSFIPKTQCNELCNRVALFYSKNVNKDKLTDGENWKVNLVISLVVFVVVIVLISTSEEVSGKMIFALVASVIFLLYSIVKLANGKG